MAASIATKTRQPRRPIEERREQVLDTALRLITTHGYGAATMEAIAREAGLAKPVVYNAYPGRGALLEALLERERARGLSTLAAAMPDAPGGDAAETLLFWLRSLAEAIGDDPETWRLILIPPAETPAVVREQVQAGRDFALAQLRTLVDEMLAERADSALDPELLARTLIAAAEHCVQLLIDDPRAYAPERLLGFAEAMIEALGLAKKAHR